MTEVQQKFIDLLKEMFQFDQADLDFGIYRIMNAKHDEIEKFLEQDLPNEIDEGLQSLGNSATAEQIKKIEEQIAAAKSMDLDAAMKEAMITKLEDQKAKLTATTNLGAAENDIYNNLLDFFSRYYDEGDFISQRRYSKGKYAIPYEGEEVKLHWANADQYYIKTSEYFKDYTFSDGFGNKVHFKILDAETEQNNNKSKDKKFFQLTEQEKKFEIIDSELYIYVEYRIGTQKTQKPYIQEIIDTFTAYANDNANEYQNFISLTIKEKGQESSLLEKQLINYTAKNNFDYFIHKDLRGFLTQELDFYIKNEVIRLDDIDETDETKTKLILTKAKVLRTIAKKIIAFLAQLEDFQKKLFLKKKFVTETNYCITLDRIDECFYKEIAANDAQRKEWIKLFAIDEIKESSGDLLTEGKCGYSEPLTEQFLKQNPYLVLDTAFFSKEFKEKLVATIDNIDDELDGLLIHSENFQALNFLQNKFNNKIDCCYIDPPYNTSENTFIYKNNYKHSSWASMIDNRVRKGKLLMRNAGVTCEAIDDYENKLIMSINDDIFGQDNHIGQLVIEIKPSGRTNDDFLATSHEYIHFYSNGNEHDEICFFELSDEQKAAYTSGDGENAYKWRDFMRTGGYSTPEERPNSFYPIYYNPETKEICLEEKTNFVKILPVDSVGKYRVWRKTKPSFLEHVQKGEIQIVTKKGSTDYKVQIIDRIKDGVRPKSVWIGSKYDSSSHGTKLLKAMFGETSPFSFPKSVYAVEDTLFALVGELDNAIVLDYFAGSGTTAHSLININRKDDGSRKYILCEMGEYFDTVTKPRVQKVIYSKDWKDGKPVSREGSSHAFKYIRLESYEDTLNNITLKSANEGLLDSARKDYFLNYMMDFESKESDSLLNIEKLAHPFDYTMKITRAQECKDQKIDLVETFNYLIGLTVTSNGALQGYDATFSTDSSKPLTATIKSGSIYRIKMIEGTNRAGERVLVIWRDLTGDIEKDNAVLDAFFAKKHVNPLDFEYKTIYVNGDNNLQNIKTEDENWKVILIESEMKKRMFSEQ